MKVTIFIIPSNKCKVQDPVGVSHGNVIKPMKVSKKDCYKLTEALLKSDENNCGNLYKCRLKKKYKTREDSKPLFSEVNDDVLDKIPTVKALRALHDNYEPVCILYGLKSCNVKLNTVTKILVILGVW